MDLFDTISSDIKAAMLARDKVRLEALRGIKKEFLEAKSAPGAGGDLSDDAAMKILVKMAKQRHESARIYTEQNRPELAEAELAEAAVIETYLPKALTPEELEAELRRIIAETGAKGPRRYGTRDGYRHQGSGGPRRRTCHLHHGKDPSGPGISHCQNL